MNQVPRSLTEEFMNQPFKPTLISIFQEEKLTDGFSIPIFIEHVIEYLDENPDTAKDDINIFILNLIENREAVILRHVINYIQLRKFIDLNYSFVYGETPLYIACEYGYSEIVQILLEGNNIKTSASKTRSKSKRKSQKKRVVYKLKTVNIDLADIFGTAPLHLVSAGNHNDILELLLSKKCNVNIQNENGSTPLHIAAEGIDSGSLVAIQLLLRRPDIFVNSTNVIQNTPLHIACLEDNSEAVRLLLKHPDIDVNIKNEDGDTPLHYAVQFEQNTEIVKLLTEFSRINVNAQNERGNTPLHYAVESANNYEIVKILLQNHNINIYTQNTIGRIPADFSNSRNIRELLQDFSKQNTKKQKT